MKIGYDAKRIVRNGTGLGNYGRTLVNDIAQYDSQLDLRLYAPDKGHDELRRLIVTRDNVSFCYPQGAFLPFYKTWWRTKGMVKNLQRDQILIYHGLSGELPLGISKTNIRSVVTIHDLIFLRHPEYYHWIDAKIYTWKFLQTIKEADRIIAISERTKLDVIEFGQVPAEKIEVIYQSCNPQFTQQLSEEQLLKVQTKFGLPRRFILSVGTIERRKNLLLAVRALDLLPDDIHLVAIGRQTDYAKEIPPSSRIHLLSGISNEELAAFYQLAEVFVYPSRYEGFGIPIIEAIHCGLPVVACTGSCLEEAGGPDNIYVHPDNVEAMATAICQSLCGADGRQERIDRSRQYVRRFEGNDVAGQVLKLYHSLLST